MDSIERTIQVNWRHRVLFSDQVFAPANADLRDLLAGTPAAGNRAKALVVLDEALASAQPGLVTSINAYFTAHGDTLALVRPPLIIEGGEEVKHSLSRVSEIYAELERHQIDRQSYLLAAGGGALLDMAGLAAATAHRGVRHVRLPTTTLSQCDSGVGVKNGINAFGKKNFIGTFCPPYGVINDFALLATLEPRDKRGGYAEAVKVACIRDRSFFETIEAEAARLARFDPEPMRQLIRRCAELHLDHIAGSGDPFEFGSARPLDFGHWAAHKLEQLSRFRLRHGEAVAIGIALDVVYARRRGYLEAPQAERVLRLLEALGFELFAPELQLAGSPLEFRVLEGLEEFRQHLGGRLAITLLQRIGSGFEAHEMSFLHLIEAIEELQARQSAREPVAVA